MESTERFAPAGVNCAMVTPFDGSGGVDLEQVRKIVRFLIEKKVDGVFPVSNVGEFLLQSMEERKSVIAAVLEEGKGRIRVMPGVSDLSIDNCLELADFSYRHGADAVVVCAPYYYPYPQDYIRRYLETVADRSKLPVVLYNSPAFACRIEFEPLMALCRHPNITAVKESSGDVKFLLKFLNALDAQGSRKSVLLGWEELLLTGLTLGAKGCMVASASIVPELLVGVRDAFQHGDMERAVGLQKEVVRIAGLAGALGFPHGYKLGVRSRGFDFRIFRGDAFQAEEMRLNESLPGFRAQVEESLSRWGLRA